MLLSEETRAVRKKAQLARLALKGTPEYPALYASQPEQIRIRNAQLSVRKVQREAKDAVNQAMLKSSNEAVDVFSNSLEVK